jgi:transcriptional regulator with XRE-family HTH domain
MMLIPPEQGRRIREIMEARGISVAELGRLIGVSRIQIFRSKGGSSRRPSGSERSPRR